MNSQIAQQLGIARHPVRKWRYRFAADRLDGLLDEPRPGRPRTMADADAERVIITTLQTTPNLYLDPPERAVVLCVDEIVEFVGCCCVRVNGSCH
ncbi:helix-turn-helix domain-containing protein [Micromonospora sp. NBC_01405]|uniref:helix-turn-helix domain-containing protein n=1 Tax=Micromonospora sp. NBC_01405 TaxID=2903589 RepID=UPI003864259C